MRTEKNTLKWLVVGLFFAASLAVTFVLFQLPEWLTQHSSAIDLTIIQEIQPLLQQLYLTVGVALLIGFGAIALLISSKNDNYSQTARHQTFVNTNDEKGESQMQKQSEDEVYLGDVESLLATDSDIEHVFKQALSQVCRTLEASQAAAFQVIEEEEQKSIELFASFAYHIPEGEKVSFRFGEGIAGQVAKEGKVVNIESVPEGYIQILSGLGKSTPNYLLVVPIKEGEQVMGVVEIASFLPFQSNEVLALESYFGKLALKLSNNDNVRLEEAKQ